MTKPAVVKKTFSSAFLLDKSKISRMLDIIKNKYNAHDFQPNISFNVTLQNNKKVSLTTLDELFALDNAVHNPISSLIINVVDLNSNLTKHFRVIIRYDNNKMGNIGNVMIQVESTESGIALQLFAEIEEQIERTLLRNWIYTAKNSDFVLLIGLIGVMLGMSFVFVAMFAALFIYPSTNGAFSTQLIEKYSGATTQEEKINFIFDYTMEQLKENQPKPIINEFGLDRILNLQSLFIMLPIMIVVGTLIYLFAKCYPYANFAWGDYEEHYAQVLSRRSTLWNLVIGSIILGILVNLFVIGLSGYFKLGQ